MAITASQPLFFSSSSFFMSILFAYSASVQLNDPDWYIWFPLYALASLVNLLVSMSLTSRHTSQIAALVLLGGAVMLLKVLAETRINGLAGFWSMDMRGRVVREKIGSVLVVISMTLQLRAPATPNLQWLRFTGVAILVASSFGLSLYFFAFVQRDMKLR